MQLKSGLSALARTARNTINIEQTCVYCSSEERIVFKLDFRRAETEQNPDNPPTLRCGIDNKLHSLTCLSWVALALNFMLSLLVCQIAENIPTHCIQGAAMPRRSSREETNLYGSLPSLRLSPQHAKFARRGGTPSV